MEMDLLDSTGLRDLILPILVGLQDLTSIHRECFGIGLCCRKECRIRKAMSVMHQTEPEAQRVICNVLRSAALSVMTAIPFVKASRIVIRISSVGEPRSLQTLSCASCANSRCLKLAAQAGRTCC
jgi:hypothetical protein